MNSSRRGCDVVSDENGYVLWRLMLAPMGDRAGQPDRQRFRKRQAEWLHEDGAVPSFTQVQQGLRQARTVAIDADERRRATRRRGTIQAELVEFPFAQVLSGDYVENGIW